MGQIYLGVQESLGRRVAIKVLPKGALVDPESVERFKREVLVLSRLSHPNICPVLEAGVDAGTHWYVMEHLRGLDLAHVLKTQRVDPRRAAAAAAQVGRALQFAHERGIVHRDVKPTNVMMQRGTRRRAGADAGAATPMRTTPLLSGIVSKFFGAKPAAAAPSEVETSVPEDPGDRTPSPEWHDHATLIDFGLAREAGSESAGLTASGAVIGTPAYMAPEQARGEKRAVGPATDVYSLGATLYEALTLRPPFSGDTVGAVLHAVMNADPAPPRRLNGLVDRDLETIVLKAMEKDPARRYASAGAMAEDLERWLAGETIRARPASFAYRLRKRIARNPLGWGAGAAAAALLLAGLWLVLAPGRIEIVGGLDRTLVSVDGRPREGPSILVWPPGRHFVEIRRPGCELFTQDVDVSARGTARVVAALVPSSAEIRLDTVPSGAEVLVAGKPLGRTPFRGRFEKGPLEILLRLADHDATELELEVRPGEDRDIVKALVHARGKLTLSSDPPEVSVELVRSGDGHTVMTASPAKETPLESGRYRATARARNCHPRTFELEVAADEVTRRHITLNPMVQWQAAVFNGFWSWLAGDVNGDRHPDLVVSSPNPPRLYALDGALGTLLWHSPMPPKTISYGIFVDMADLDGDLDPEIVYAHGDREVTIVDAATGLTERTIPCLGGEHARTWGDHDGDARADIVLVGGGGLLCLRGVDGRELWAYKDPGELHMTAARLNGDGAPDIVARSLTAHDRPGRIVAVDGRTGRLLWEREAKGGGLPVVGDLDGDGVDDAMAGDGGAGLALSGRDGSVLWRKPGVLGPGYHDGAVGDLDGDGRPEIVVAGAQLVRVLDARTGELRLEMPGIDRLSSPRVADVAGDARLEILYASGPTLFARDSATGDVAWAFDSDSVSSAPPLLADFDGDGRQDVAWFSGSGQVSMLAVKTPPLLWKQGLCHFHAENAEFVGDPPRGVFFAGSPHRLLRPLDGDVIAERRIAELKLSGTAGASGSQGLLLEGDGTALLDPVTLEIRWKNSDHKGTWTVPQAFELNGDGVEDVLKGDAWRGRGIWALDGRTGAELWTQDVLRVHRGRACLHAGLLWVPCNDGIRGLDPATGEVRSFLRTPQAAGSVVPCGEDLVFVGGTGIVARARILPGGALERIWEEEFRYTLTRHSPALLGSRVVVTASNGLVAALDAGTGRVLWRTVLRTGMGGAAALRDLDADGQPEAGVVLADGTVQVLRGTDGEVVWTWRVQSGMGWICPPWLDLDGDGAPELLVTCRDGYLRALTTRLESDPVTTIARSWIRTPRAAAEWSAEESLRQRLMDEFRQQRWDRVVALASESTSARGAWQGAIAASQAGDRAAVRLFAEKARERGCRRLDLELADAAASDDPGRADRLASALRAMPEPQILALPLGPEHAELWRAATAKTLPDVEAAGDWNRAMLLLAALGDWEPALACSERARAAGADPGRVAFALGRAAARARRYEDATRLLREASLSGTAIDLAKAELESLARSAQESYRAGVSAFRSGRIAEGRAHALRALGVCPDRGEWFNDLAYTLAIAPGATREDALAAIVWAKRSIELHASRTPNDKVALSMRLDTLAAAHFAAGELEEAVRVQREAVALPMKGDQAEGMRAMLEKYERAVRDAR
jgi:outer membrane protein assembly factor BamB/tetratricopeptide (TPR) repeat protein